MNPRTTPRKSKIAPEKLQFMFAEYNALRNEIIKRSEYRYQILSLTLVIAGSILTFGLQPTAPAHILFVFPIIACFLAGIWSHNIIIPRQISSFIRENIESKFDNWGWETAVKEEIFTTSWRSGIISSSGIFLGTEIITIILGLFKSTFTPMDITLVAIDGIAIIITLVALRATTQKPKSNRR